MGSPDHLRHQHRSTAASSSSGSNMKKKVEWSSTLTAAAVEDRSPNNQHLEDPETHDMFSYFLGGDEWEGKSPPGGGPPPVLLSTSSGNTGGLLHHSAMRPPPMNGILHRRPQPNGETTVEDDEEDVMMPPPTPAIHYYHPSSKEKHGKRNPGLVASSSSVLRESSSPHQAGAAFTEKVGSMSKSEYMLPKAVRGRNTGETMGVSPISPAAMMMDASEPLMLPPSPDVPASALLLEPTAPNAAGGGMALLPPSGGLIPPPAEQQQQHPPPQTTSGVPTQQQQQQSHIQWLNHINYLAQQAKAPGSASASAAPTGPPPPISAHPVPIALTPAAPYPVGDTTTTTTTAIIPDTTAVLPSYYTMFYPGTTNPLLPAEESEEKRSRRLERNRESARRSRRKKKERLTTLEAQVDRLYGQLEKARRTDIAAMGQMGTPWQQVLPLEKESLLRHYQQRDQGLNAPVRRAVTDFQYTALDKVILPKYQKFVLWLTLHHSTTNHHSKDDDDESSNFFMAGKERYMKELPDKQAAAAGAAAVVVRQPIGKVSSKLVGDELTNGPKKAAGTKKKKQAQAAAPTTANAFDVHRMWPLLCYELSISVDQEERMIQTFRTLQVQEHLQRDRVQIAAATRMVANLKEAVLYQSHNAAMRSERSYTDILNPDQLLKYHEFLLEKKVKIRAISAGGDNRDKPADSHNNNKTRGVATSDSSHHTTTKTESSCLMDVCRKLEEVLKISKGETAVPPMPMEN